MNKDIITQNIFQELQVVYNAVHVKSCNIYFDLIYNSTI